MRKRLFFAGAFLMCVVAAGAFALQPAAIPPDVIQAAVTQTEAPLEEAWSLPVAATYRPSFTYQSSASRCGPASLANVFRSLGYGPQSESGALGDTGYCWTGYCIIGLTLDELAEVARANAKSVEVMRDLTLEQFREEMRHANDPSRRYVVNFTRKEIFGAGAGHHSPIGGYLDAVDMVLVLDVNENIKPWLVETNRLFAAMDTVDSDGGRKRGLLRIQ